MLRIQNASIKKCLSINWNKKGSLITILIYLTFSATVNFSQLDTSKTELKFVLIHGKVLDQVTNKGMPFVGITAQSIQKGVTTNEKGNFSIMCYTKDTLRFSFIGYKSRQIPIHTDSAKSMYVQVYMKEDTILLNEKTIYPWPSKEQFKEAFLNTNLPPSEQQIAMKNLDQNILNGKMNAYQAPLYETNYNRFIDKMKIQREARWKVSPFQDMFTIGVPFKGIKNLITKKKPPKLL